MNMMNHNQQSNVLSSNINNNNNGNINNQNNNNDIKTELICRDGIYRLIPNCEYGRPKSAQHHFNTTMNLSNNQVTNNLNQSNIGHHHHNINSSPYAAANIHHQTSMQSSANNNANNNSLNSVSGTNNSNNGGTSSSLPMVRISFTKIIQQHRTSCTGSTTNGHHQRSSPCSLAEDDKEHYISHNHQQQIIQERICFNHGWELFIYNFNDDEAVISANLDAYNQPSTTSLLPPSSSTLLLIDRQAYKSTSPTCHDFYTNIDQRQSLLLIGFSLGQIQLIDQYREMNNKFFNQDRLIDKSKVTCIKWLPRSRTEFLVSYSSGQMYLYRENLPCFTATPTYQQYKFGDGFAIYTCKTKTNRNPLFRWSIGGNTTNINMNSHFNDNNSSINDSHHQTNINLCNLSSASINEFAFSPCGHYLAVVSQDGFLRVFHYAQMELIGQMRSYFGGLLCVGWSPDSKFLVTGGEDDLITVWSLQDKRVIARGQGHKSWINSVTFDPFMTYTKDDRDELDDIDYNDNYETNDDSISISNSTSNYRKQSSDNGHNQFKLLNNYRIGSVGQDTQICLWDLTDDIIRQSSVIKSRSRSNIITNTSSNSNPSSSTTTAATTTTATISTTATTSSTATNSKNNQTENRHHHFFFNSLKKSSHKKSGVFSLSSRSFLDKSGHHKDKDKNSSSASNSSNLNTSNTSSKNVNNNNLNNITNQSTSISFNSSSNGLLGTSICPRLRDVPMLSPLVCKKISNERLTSLVFRNDSFVVANHEGKIMVFARPESINSNDNRTRIDGSKKICSPNASMASDVNDISFCSRD